MPQVLAALLILSQVPAEATPVAMVLTTTGAVTWRRGPDEPRPLQVMQLLRAQDRLQAAAAAEATLFFLSNGHRERLKPGAEATVGEQGCAPAKAVEALPRQPKLSAPQLASLRDLTRSGRAGVGVLRGDKPPTAQVVRPMFGATVVTTRPALSWPPAAEAERYQVQLLSGDAREILWHVNTTEPRLSFPEQAAALRPLATYRWKVYAYRGEGQWQKWVDSKFAVATEEEATAVAQLQPLAAGTDPGNLLLAAAVCEAHGIYDEALRLYERLAELLPAAAQVHATLANYYERAGRTEQARAARSRAALLGAQVPTR